MLLFYLFLTYFWFLPYSLIAHSHIPCCLDSGVSEHCANVLCDLHRVPNDLERYSVFEDGPKSCSKYVKQISKCLSNGRDSTECCQKNAESPDDSFCFGFCNGSFPSFRENIIPLSKLFSLQICFSLNADAIYSCIRTSHQKSPSPPRDLVVVNKSENAITLEWKAPLKNPQNVMTYKVHVIESQEMNERETIHLIKQNLINIGNLSNTSLYSIFVVAYGKRNDLYSSEYFKSQRSNIIFVRTGSPVAIFNSTIFLPINAKSTLLSCKLKSSVIVDNNSKIQWTKTSDSTKNSTKHYENCSSTYLSLDENNSKILLSSLSLRNLTFSDFGTFRCQIESHSEIYGEINLTPYSYSLYDPPVNPPDTIYECCSKSVERPECQTICSSRTQDKTLFIRPANYVPSLNCYDELNNLLKCSLSQVRTEACCIAEQVPYQCLGLCNRNYSLNQRDLAKCASFIKSSFYCQSQEKKLRPEAVSGIESYMLTSNTFNFTWVPSRKTKVYHIYKRKSMKPWSSTLVNTTSATISDADEIAFIAVNDYGFSSQHRLNYFNNEWVTANY